MTEPENDWDDYETGPFCQHWCSPPGDCEKKCECGHECAQHWGELECRAEGCECERFTEAENNEQ